MRTEAVLGGAPAWIWLLLVALIGLGVRRLRTREVPLAVALIPALAFFGWSLFGAAGFAASAGAATARTAWVGGLAAGALSAMLLPETRGIRLPGGRVRQPGSRLPLALYLTVFVARFVCGAWAAINPAQATIALATGVAIGAAMTGRLVTNIARWRSAAAGQRIA